MCEPFLCVLNCVGKVTRPSINHGFLKRLKRVWNDRNISLSSKIRLMRSPVTSIFLYVCESCTLTAEQYWQGWNQFGMTGVFLSVPRYDWCARLSHPSFCMLANHGSWQQSSKKEYKPWKWGAMARYYASHTKTMLPTRKSMLRSSRWSDRTKTSLPS